jgi:16S rRNA (guanine1207-N2)-methyltransferase
MADRAPDLDRLREDIEFEATLAGQALRVRTTWGLFSPREIDSGTRLLLDHVDVRPDDDCLDLGCGYGAIGLTLARLAPAGRTLLVDKDFVAVEYARKNAALNGVANAEVQLSNAFRDIPVERRFSLIASNIPARAGNEMLTLMIADARERLAPSGRLYLVGLTGMRKFVQRVMQEQFGNYEKLKQGPDYTVATALR